MNKRIVNERKVKTSNILLLVIFLVIGLFFCSFIASVDYKLKDKNFTYSNGDKSLYSRHKFDTRKVVVIKNLNNCTLVLSDSVSIEVFNDDKDKFEYSVTSDSITINQRKRSENRLLVYLPSGTTLVANSSVVAMNGSFDYNNQTSYAVVLRDSELNVSSGGSHTFFENLKVDGFGRSQLVVGDFTHVQNLHVSDITDVRLAKGWQIGRFTSSFSRGAEMTKLGDSVSIATQ